MPNDSASEIMTQQAPWPTALVDLVDNIQYRPGWRFHLDHVDRGQGSAGLTLQIFTRGYDTYHVELGQNYGVVHYFPVPPAAYNEQSWRRWVFDRLQEVERHECAEFFRVDGERPYAPHHGPGWDPYIIIEHGTDEDRRTRFTGEVVSEEDEVLKRAREKIARHYYRVMMRDDYDEFPWDDENIPSNETKEEAESFAAGVVL